MLHIEFDETDSTNLRCKELVAQHRDEVVLVSAKTQTHGSGRNDRQWSSPVGGAWMTLGWPLSGGAMAPHITLVAGLAVMHSLVALDPSLEGRFQIKWPNDIWIDGGKLAGILCQYETGASHLFIGIGVNVSMSKSDLQGEMRYPPKTLRDLGSDLSASEVVCSVAEHLIDELSNMSAESLTDAQCEQIDSLLLWKGSPVSLESSGGVATGLLQGLDKSGGLCVNCDGEKRVFTGGEVSCLSIVEPS